MGRAGADGSADSHDDDGDLQSEVAAKDVGDLGPEREEGGRGEVEGGDDPVELAYLIYKGIGGATVNTAGSWREKRGEGEGEALETWLYKTY